jgi:hypothetical protein
MLAHCYKNISGIFIADACAGSITGRIVMAAAHVHPGGPGGPGGRVGGGGTHLLAQKRTL